MKLNQDQSVEIESKHQLVEYFENSCKKKELWKIGTEHEKFGFNNKNFKPLDYYGSPGILQILEGLVNFGWKPKYENKKIISLVLGEQSVTLEPGGQLELSGAPLRNIHETCSEVNKHLSQIREISKNTGATFIGLGFQPRHKLEEIPMMPKSRYEIMRNYMPKQGKHGLDMMFRSCTVQANLDFSSESDMVKKFRVSLALQPVITALFANSPFKDGRLSKYLSYRSYVWMHTDPDRCGILPFVFEPGMGFERYVDYALDVPMYFIHRDGKYLNVAGESFREFLIGKNSALPGEKPTILDWEDHLTTIFPEVRMKRFLEMRGADGGPWEGLCALPAFWVGLLYDDSSVEAAWDICKSFTHEENVALRNNVPMYGLKTPFRQNLTVKDLAGEILKISKQGLKNRKCFDSSGNDESGFLEILFEIQDRGISPAELMIQQFHEKWNDSVESIFIEGSY